MYLQYSKYKKGLLYQVMCDLVLGHKQLMRLDNLLLLKKSNFYKANEKNYNSLKGNFTVKERNITTRLEPELRIYNQPNIITSEADIKTTLISDTFIVMNSVKNKDYFNIRYQVKTFMVWIWISVLIISFGGILSLIKKNYAK